VQLINGTDFAWKMKKSLGDKRIDRFQHITAFVELALSRKRKDRKKIIKEELRGAEAQAAILEVPGGMKGAFAAGQLVKDRTALITAATTGKIDVRHVQIPVSSVSETQ